MLNLLLYQSTEQPLLEAAELAQILSQHGAQLRAAGNDYWSGHWHDPISKAGMDIDVGHLPLDLADGTATTHHDDVNAPNKDYPGWRELGVSLSVPLTGPHWYVADIGAWLQDLLPEIPGSSILISEDVGVEGEPGYGPGPLDRPRLLRCWEACHAEQTATLSLPRMQRRSSLALWRYRREYALGKARYPHLHWPEALVLGRGSQAYSTLIWENPQQAMAIPAVDYVVIQRANEAGLLPTDELLTAAAGGQPLDIAGALSIAPSPAGDDLFARAHLLAPSHFQALHDYDWSD